MVRIGNGGLLLLLAAYCCCSCATRRGVSRPSHGPSLRLEMPKANRTPTRWDSNSSDEVKVLSRASTEDASLEKAARAHAHYGAGIIHEMNEDADASLNEYYLAALDDPGN